VRTFPRMAAEDGTSVLSKRMLVELSHAIERFALTAEPDAPLVVIALFQKLSYFEREVAVYADIAGRGAVTIVGLAEDFPPTLPAGVRHTLFGPENPLAREWSVNVLGPSGGASLVAIDLESVADDAPTLEQGRQFRGRWSFRREDAYREVLRLRSQLRLPPSTIADVDAVLQSVVAVPERAQAWWDVPLRFLADRLEAAIRGRDRASAELEVAQQGSAQRDPRTACSPPPTWNAGPAAWARARCPLVWWCSACSTWNRSARSTACASRSRRCRPSPAPCTS
jgi:DICT domain-containing protein